MIYNRSIDPKTANIIAEQVTGHLSGHCITLRYLHSDMQTIECVEILRDMRFGTFDDLTCCAWVLPTS